MAIDNTRDDNLQYVRTMSSYRELELTYSRQGNTVGNLADNNARGSQSRRSHVLPSEAVDDHSRHNVQSNVDTLHETQGFGVILGVTQFRHESEKCNVTGCHLVRSYLDKSIEERTEREHDLANGLECLVEVGVYRPKDVFSVRLFNAHANHSDDHGTEDTDKGW